MTSPDATLNAPDAAEIRVARYHMLAAVCDQKLHSTPSRLIILFLLLTTGRIHVSRLIVLDLSA